MDPKGALKKKANSKARGRLQAPFLQCDPVLWAQGPNCPVGLHLPL